MELQNSIALDWARLGCPFTACNVCILSGPAKRTVDKQYVCAACDKKHREENMNA